MDFLGLSDPFRQTMVLRLLSGAVSLFAVLLLVRDHLGDMASARAAHWLVGLSLLLWFIPFLDVRFSSEAWSAACMLIAVVVARGSERQALGMDRFALLGMLLGLAFLFRYQTAIMAVGIVGWLLVIRREPFRDLLPLFAAGIVVLAFGTLIDRWFYGDWVFAPWNYVHANLIEGKAASFGTAPWWGYFKLLVEPPLLLFGALLLASFAAFFLLYPRNVITWASVPFLLVHMALSHKELRFLFPLAPLAGLVFVMSVSRLAEKGVWPSATATRDRLVKWGGMAFWVVNVPALLIMSARPAAFALSPAVQLAEIQGDAEVVLLYPRDQSGPFGDELEMNFYKQAGLTERPIEGVQELGRYVRSAGKHILFLLHEDPGGIGRVNFDGGHCDVVRRPPDRVAEYMVNSGWAVKLGIPVFYECRTAGRSRSPASERVEPDRRAGDPASSSPDAVSGSSRGVMALRLDA
jgi:phosphatidylinositol glycan class B